MKKALLVLLFSLTGATLLHAQHLIRGTLLDAATRETLAGATVRLKDGSAGTACDANGRFELAFNGSYPVVLVCSSMGYESRETEIREAGEVNISLPPANATLGEITVTSRRRKEVAQEVPIPITVLGAPQLDNSVSFNVNRVKELVPSVQLYSSNPRNTTLNIRGLGSTFGLTNDGIDPGVGFYVDGVYYARPAATTIDFIDVEQIEVLRGPQGTLFGKNTTAGAFNVTTRKPSFTTSGTFELSYGNLGFVQAKGALSGALWKDKLAGRISFTGTHRDGVIDNIATESKTNTLNNLGFRGQLLFTPSSGVEMLLTADHSRQRPDGYAQTLAGVVRTRRSDYRQFDNIISDLNYTTPTRNGFDRIVDTNTPWRSGQDLGGVSLNADIKTGKGTLTSTSAWRYWNWDPSNDRDFTGLDALRVSRAPSRHDQWSQEIRYAADFNSGLSGVFGVFAFYQHLRPDSAHVEEAGKDQWRFSQNSTNPLWATPGLLDGYGIRTYPELRNFSGAVFGQLDWTLYENLHLLPGIRINYDQKAVDFRRETYGGLATTDPKLIALQQAVYSNQSFSADIDDANISGQLSVAWHFHPRYRAFATSAISYKPVGLNLGGLPNLDGQPMTELAVVRPEQVYHYEAGLKSEPLEQMLVNLTIYQTEIRDYQTLVQAPDLAVNRGYLANAAKVRVQGLEADASYRITTNILFNASVSYTDGRYIDFQNAPPALEETGGPTFTDASGGRLPGISRWAGSAGFEYSRKGRALGKKGEWFAATDAFYRSGFSSSPTPSRFLNIDGYSLLNGRIGFRTIENISFFLWCRNLLDTDYYELLLPGAGNVGHYAAVVGDPRTWGITLRAQLQ